MNRIYAYYESIPLSNQSEEFSCANYWKQSWEKNGWEAVMLNRSHAQGSRLYNKLQQKLMKEVMGMPQELQSRVPWVVARFARLCALQAAGGGWMSDYDVVNVCLTPEYAADILGNETIMSNKGSAHIIYATKEHAERAINKIISSDLIENLQVIPEHQILGLKPSAAIGKAIKHVREKDGKTRSELMKTLVEKSK